MSKSTCRDAPPAMNDGHRKETATFHSRTSSPFAASKSSHLKENSATLPDAPATDAPDDETPCAEHDHESDDAVLPKIHPSDSIVVDPGGVNNEATGETVPTTDVQNESMTPLSSALVQNGTSIDIHYSNGLNLDATTSAQAGLRRRHIPITEPTPESPDHVSKAPIDEEMSLPRWSVISICKAAVGIPFAVVMSVVQFIRDCKYFLDLCVWADFERSVPDEDED
jgi:hypothetical protein